MSDVSTILLVPSDAYREALLGDGPCGARVPVMWRPWREDYGDPENGGSWDDEWAYRGDGCYDHTDSGELETMALVLAHDGRVVREGRGRAAYVLANGFPEQLADRRGGFGLTFGRAHSRVWALHGPSGRGVAFGPGDLSVAARPRSAEEYVAVDGMPAHFDDLVTTIALATVCAARGLGTVVLLDADGVEVSRG